MEVIASATATEADLKVVRMRLEVLPEAIRKALRKRGISLLVCRDNVTTSGRAVFDEPPRNWPEGKHWVDVPGCFIPETNEVVIATLGEGEERHVPLRGEKHGSRDLVFHEVMHADDIELVDNEWRRRSNNTDFQGAWRDDIAAGGFANYAYEAKVSEEGYAESAARFFADDRAMVDQWPKLYRFWGRSPLPIMPEAIAGTRSLSHDHSGAIGTARLTPEGRYELDLVATSSSGMVGHALMVLDPDEPASWQVSKQVSDRRGDMLNGVAILLESFR